MTYDEFIGQVQNRARLSSKEEAVKAIRATFEMHFFSARFRQHQLLNHLRPQLIISLTFFLLCNTVACSASPDIPHATDFLTAGCFTHVIPGMSSSARSSCIGNLTKRYYTHAYVYVYNEEDYGGPSFDFYTNTAGFRKILQEIKDAGLKPVVWLNPDDAPINKARSTSELKNRMSNFIPHIDDLVSSYVLGLEIDEYWGQTKVNELGFHLRTLTKKPIANHQLSDNWEFCKASWCDFMIMQYASANREVNPIKTRTKEVIQALGKPLVAGEYNEVKNAESKSIRLGDAAVSAGASGFGNGGTPGAPLSNNPPNAASNPVPTNNPGWSYTNALTAGTINFSWKSNGDPDGSGPI